MCVVEQRKLGMLYPDALEGANMTKKKSQKMTMDLSEWEEVIRRYILPEIKEAVMPVVKRLEMLEDILGIRTMAHEDPFLVDQMKNVYSAGLELRIRNLVNEMLDTVLGKK